MDLFLARGMIPLQSAARPERQRASVPADLRQCSHEDQQNLYLHILLKMPKTEATSYTPMPLRYLSNS